MGTYSTFHLELKGAGGKAEEVISGLRSAYPEARSALSKYGDGDDSVKWYDAADDLRTYSAQWPNVTFVLTRKVETGRMEKTMAQNGRAQTVTGVVHFPPFDEMDGSLVAPQVSGE